MHLPLVFLILLLIFPFNTEAELKEIKIGAIFSLSGWAALGGVPELNGVRMAIDDINASGGINGQQLSLVVEDNRSDFKSTAQAFQKLASLDKVSGIIGPNWAEFSEVITPLASAKKVPVITASGYHDSYKSLKPWMFSVWPTREVATRVLADFIISKKHKKITALVSENGYFQNVLSAIRPQLSAGGVEIIDVQSFAPGFHDYRSAISKLKRSSADAVLAFLMESGDLSAFIRQRSEQQLEIPVYAANTLPYDAALRANLDLAEGLIYFDYFVPGGPEFAKRYFERYNEPPGFASAKAYDSTVILVKAIERCGDSPESVRLCIAEVNHPGLSGQIRFAANGVISDMNSNTELYKIEGGKLVRMESTR